MSQRLNWIHNKSISTPGQLGSGLRWTIADRLGFGALLVLVATGPSPSIGTTVHQTAMALLVLAALIVARELWPYLRRCKIAWLTLALIAYLVLRHGLALFENPGGLPSNNPYTADLLRVSVLIPLLGGFWLRGDTVRLRWFVAAGLFGIFLFLVHDVDWGSLFGLDFYRHMFGSKNPNRAGLMAALLLLATCALGWGAIHWLRTNGYRWLVLAVTLLVIVGFATCLGVVLVVTASRGSWLAFLSSLPVFLILIVMAVWPDMLRSLRAWLVGVALAVLVSSALLGGTMYFSETVSSRVSEVTNSVHSFLESPDEALQNKGSIYYRIQLWHGGIIGLAERPLIGHGPQMNERPATVPSGRNFGHLHNLYIETLYAWGLIGFLLFFAGHVALFGSAASSYRRGMPAVFIHAYGFAALVGIGFYVMTTGPIYQYFFRVTFIFVATLVASAYWWGWLDDQRSGQPQLRR